jgi:hypothetical protein
MNPDVTPYRMWLDVSVSPIKIINKAIFIILTPSNLVCTQYDGICQNTNITCDGNIRYGVTSGFIFLTVQSVTNLPFKHECMQRAVFWLSNVLNSCIWYDPVAVVSNNKNNVSSVMYEDSQVLACVF